MYYSYSHCYVLQLFSLLCTTAILIAMYYSYSHCYVLQLLSLLCTTAILIAMYYTLQLSFIFYKVLSKF